MSTTQQQLLIDGEWRAAASGREYTQTFPYTGEPVGTAAAADREEFTELRWITIQEQPRQYPI